MICQCLHDTPAVPAVYGIFRDWEKAEIKIEFPALRLSLSFYPSMCRAIFKMFITQN